MTKLVKILITISVGFVFAYVLLKNLEQNVIYFYTPSQITDKINLNKTIRIGGVVANGSIKYNGNTVSFITSDFTSTIKVIYTGVLPNLFREGQGIVAIGKIKQLRGDFVLYASEILAKHDEKYMSEAEYKKLRQQYENKQQ